MELKDYLHLYKNCNVQGRGRLTYINNSDFQNMLANGDYSFSYEDIKLILRPLSSMTEEEANEWYQGKIPHPLHAWKNYGNNTENRYKPEKFVWLLSKHFDLFGLIDAGLAIDATTINK